MNACLGQHISDCPQSLLSSFYQLFPIILNLFSRMLNICKKSVIIFGRAWMLVLTYLYPIVLNLSFLVGWMVTVQCAVQLKKCHLFILIVSDHSKSVAQVADNVKPSYTHKVFCWWIALTYIFPIYRNLLKLVGQFLFKKCDSPLSKLFPII